MTPYFKEQLGCDGRAALSATQPAQAAQSETCPTCGESEPYFGACGTSASDTRALCKRKAQAAQGAGEVVAYLQVCGNARTLVDASRPLDDDDRELGWTERPLTYADVATPAQPAPVVPDEAVMLVGDELARKHAVYLNVSSVRDLLSRAFAATPTPPAQTDTDWQEPHPPSRHCMCPSCIPSFDARFAPQAQPAPVVPDGWQELCRRLYVELWHCDKQMTSTLNDDDEPVWTTGPEVRDVLRDAKSALEGATPTPPAQAAADARDALLTESARWEKSDHRLAVWEALRVLGSRMGVMVTREDQYAALATHQQRQDGGSAATPG